MAGLSTWPWRHRAAPSVKGRNIVSVKIISAVLLISLPTFLFSAQCLRFRLFIYEDVYKTRFMLSDFC